MNYWHLNAWLTGSWADGASHRAEQIFLCMQAVEMATDVIRDRSYPGFGASYLQHHLATLFAAIAALYLTVPVGGVVAFGTMLEAGGAVLNVVSLYVPTTALLRRLRAAPGSSSGSGSGKPPAWLLDVRVLLFSATRILAALVLGQTTRAALLLERPPWVAIIFAWAILAVNSRWVVALLHSFRSKKDAMDAFSE
jgi:hypothetical protein